jgi:5'-nucleotidase
MPSSTASAFPATAVGGSPADTVLFGVLQALPSRPDLVVSGVNNGQNLADLSGISGTVGAALWAARLGIPAFAVSAGLGASPNYAQAADYTAALVERFRQHVDFRTHMVGRKAPRRGVVLNINFPTCTAGSVRGVRVVPLGRLSTVTGYTLLADVSGVKTWKVNVASASLASNCASTAVNPQTDVEAFAEGFATVTPLDADATVSGARLANFRFAERVPF